MSGRTKEEEVFSSEGFDLGALANAEGQGDDVVLEIGGGTSPVVVEKEKEESPQSTTPDRIGKSEECKAKGNEHFKKGNYLDAYDYYTEAIESCPGMTGNEILQLKQEHEEQEREKAYEKHRKETEFRRQQQTNSQTTKDKEPSSSSSSLEESSEKEKEEEEVVKPFVVPEHEYADKLAVYHCNRAACLLHRQQNEDAIDDCTIALLLNPRYVRAYVRRMTAYERLDQTEEALGDAKEALQLDNTKPIHHQHVTRLQQKENERMEKLKEETMGKLKDLGNSILGNFGLSLDNFQAQQDPNTGSYNISFNK